MAAQARSGMPAPGGAAAATAGGRQRGHELPALLCWQVRHVCRRRLRGIRALLLRRPARCGDLQVALRAEGREIQARGLNLFASPLWGGKSAPLSYTFGSFWRSLPMSAHGSFLKCCFRSSTVNVLLASTLPSSSQVTGAETGAPARARLE